MLSSTSSKQNCCSKTYLKANMNHQDCQLRLDHTFSRSRVEPTQCLISSIFKWHHTAEGIWLKSRNGACDSMSSACATLEYGFFLQVDYTIVRISARIILYIMLDHLGIRRAIYCRRMYSQNTISVIMLFYTSVQSNGICILYCTATL